MGVCLIPPLQGKGQLRVAKVFPIIKCTYTVYIDNVSNISANSSIYRYQFAGEVMMDMYQFVEEVTTDM